LRKLIVSVKRHGIFALQLSKKEHNGLVYYVQTARMYK
jgi:hypothetical protein